MNKLIIGTAVATSLLFASSAFAQSTVTGTLSSGSGGTTSSGSGTTVTGTVGSGNSLTGTVSTPSSGGGGGGGTTVSGNGPPVGGGGGGGGPDTTVICPNLPNSLYTLPSGYEILDGACDPIGSVPVTTTPGTGASTPGIPNTGAGGDSESNEIVLTLSGLLGAAAGITLLRRKFA